ncbi:MAG: hypothetical protein ACRCTR_08580 [Actinomycetota bacterium]
MLEQPLPGALTPGLIGFLVFGSFMRAFPIARRKDGSYGILAAAGIVLTDFDDQ